MAFTLKSLLGGGVSPNAVGRKATPVGDRDVASRDTVYRKPKPKAAAKKPAGGGGGAPVLPQTAPIPQANPMAPVATSPSSITPPMGAMGPTTQPGFVPTQSMTSVPGMDAMGPTTVPNAFPTVSPTSVPGPGRAELAALAGPAAVQQAGMAQPGVLQKLNQLQMPYENEMNQWGRKNMGIIGRLFGGSVP